MGPKFPGNIETMAIQCQCMQVKLQISRIALINTHIAHAHPFVFGSRLGLHGFFSTHWSHDRSEGAAIKEVLHMSSVGNGV